jgi:hypothetical protein
MIERKTFEHGDTQDEFTVVMEGNHLVADEIDLLSLSTRRVSSAAEEGVLSNETLYAFFCAVHNLETSPTNTIKDSLDRIHDKAVGSNLTKSDRVSIRNKIRAFVKEHGVSSLVFATLISIPGTFGIYIESQANTVGKNFYSHKNNIIDTTLNMDVVPIMESIADRESIEIDTDKINPKEISNIDLLSIPYAQKVLNINFEQSTKNSISKNLGNILSIPNTTSRYPVGESAYIYFINKAASYYKVSSSIMVNIIKCESQFEPEIPNSQSSGAYGIAQFMPNTFYNKKINPYISYGIGNPYAQIAEMAKLISEKQIWRWSCAP